MGTNSPRLVRARAAAGTRRQAALVAAAVNEQLEVDGLAIADLGLQHGRIDTDISTSADGVTADGGVPEDTVL